MRATTTIGTDQRLAAVSGTLEASHGQLIVDGELLDDAIADLLKLGRRQYGALSDSVVGDVTITVDVRRAARE